MQTYFMIEAVTNLSSVLDNKLEALVRPAFGVRSTQMRVKIYKLEPFQKFICVSVLFFRKTLYF